MVVFPLAATAVSVVFSIALFRRYTRRQRLPELAWGIALAMFAIASLTVALGMVNGWDPTLFRTFWLFGALLNVPWLALGSIALVGRRPISLVALVAVLVGTVYATIKVSGAVVSPEIIGLTEIPRGADALADAPDVRTLAQWYSIPSWLVVVLIAVFSSIPRGGRRLQVQRVRGNWLIAVGVTVVAVGSFALGRIGQGEAFAIAKAIGVLIMYIGFVTASRTPAPAITGQSPGSEPPDSTAADGTAREAAHSEPAAEDLPPPSDTP